MTTKLYSLAKKIHRIFLFSTTLLVLIMALTGSVLKYSIIVSKFSFINLALTRSLHNNLSPFLTISLLVMMTTGLIMYLYPLMQKK